MWRRHNSARNRGKYPFLCTLAAPLLPLRPSILMEKSFPEMNHREPRTSGDTALTAWRLPSSPCRVLTDSSDGHNHKEWPGTKTRTEATHKLPKNFFFLTQKAVGGRVKQFTGDLRISVSLGESSFPNQRRNQNEGSLVSIQG